MSTRLPTSFQRGNCGSTIVKMVLGKNVSTVSLKHQYQVNGAFREFDQTATFLKTKFKSVWSVNYNASISSKLRMTVDGNYDE